MQYYHLLVVDDDDLVVQSIRMGLPPHWRMSSINSSAQLNPHIMFHAAFVDMHLNPKSDVAEGLKVLDKISRENTQIETVAISGDLSLELMEACLKRGASRFLAKPLHLDEVLDTLAKIEAHWQLRQKPASMTFKTPWIGSGSASAKIKKDLAALKGEPGPILIEGESGTGKEVIVSLLHQQESRGSLVSVNLAAIPENLFESEIFGHLKGAFTGADQNKIGLAEASHGGDLFLDEVEALPLSFQVKLLRFLESGEIKKVGSKETTFVKTRVLIATNQNLNQLVQKGLFREDLLWRMSGKKVNVPPLRERPEDIPELAQHFLNQERPRRNKSFAPDALSAMQEYSWPGNVRELKRLCEQLSLSSPLPVIRASDVNRWLSPTLDLGGIIPSVDLDKGLNTLVAEFETSVIKRAMELQPDVDEAARLLQISRSSLYKKIKDYHIGQGE